MRKKITLLILLVLAAIIAIVLILGYRVWNKPHQDIYLAPSVIMTSVGLYSYLSNNGVEKRSLLINKVVTISGTVKEVSINRLGQPVIMLKTSVNGGSVNCTMEQHENSIKICDTVFLKGICTGYIEGDKDLDLPGDVYLTRCYQLK
jgi:hypothetical protein